MDCAAPGETIPAWGCRYNYTSQRRHVRRPRPASAAPNGYGFGCSLNWSRPCTCPAWQSIFGHGARRRNRSRCSNRSRNAFVPRGRRWMYPCPPHLGQFTRISLSFLTTPANADACSPQAPPRPRRAVLGCRAQEPAGSGCKFGPRSISWPAYPDFPDRYTRYP